MENDDISVSIKTEEKGGKLTIHIPLILQVSSTGFEHTTTPHRWSSLCRGEGRIRQEVPECLNEESSTEHRS